LADLTKSHPKENVWVIGGAFVFAEAIDRADELFITQVLGDFHCTKFFPDYRSGFTRFEQGAVEQESGVQYRFERWRRNTEPRIGL
jgi:dihydrofolate reductase